MFDITKLSQSSFRGIPFYTRDDDLSGGQRLTDHSFINGGTKTESNGVQNNTIKISGYIGGDNYLTQKEALKEALENITSGILVSKFYGEIEVFVDSWSIKESIKAFGQAEIDFTFKKAQNNVIEESLIVYTADARPEALEYFQEEFENEAGVEVNKTITQEAIGFLEEIEGAVKFVKDDIGVMRNIVDQIGRMKTRLANDILDIVSISDDIQDLWEAFDEVLDFDITSVLDQKSFTNTLRKSIEEPKTSTYEAQSIAYQSAQVYKNTIIAGSLQTAIKNLANVDFTIGDDFGSVKDDILTIFDLLESGISYSADEINKIIINQNLVDKYQISRREFIQFYTERFSSLQTLNDNEIVSTTDAITLTIERYNDITRIDEVLTNNGLVDPIFINGTVKLLDR